MKDGKMSQTIEEEILVSLPINYLDKVEPEEKKDFIKKAVFLMACFRGDLPKEKIISILSEKEDYKDLQKLLKIEINKNPKNTKWSKFANDVEELGIKYTSEDFLKIIKSFRENLIFNK